ncbi:MAG: hypothetical protein JRF31_12370 [Deltaproteobacteria bacterium]|nr:hypothetical protein [Deltaproteobacteria bacterium]MBW2090127.1 hypothetical protein [Deltaproteobacteria bacterium]MBW2321603.1 hypothetical protein [Deltaproteobacteria bacterium]
MGTSIDSGFIEKYEPIITQLGFKDLKSFVKNQALIMMMAKMEKYEAEIKRFEVKYRMNFEGFQDKIKGVKNKEVFKEEDDYLDWRFAKESLARLTRQKRELEYA